MNNGQQFPDDFLAQHGFSPEEQESAANKAQADSDLINKHHDAFHENINAFHNHLNAYHKTSDENHFLSAMESVQLAKSHHKIYRDASGQSLLGKGDDYGNCTHCGGFLGTAQ